MWRMLSDLLSLGPDWTKTYPETDSKPVRIGFFRPPKGKLGGGFK